MEFAARRWSDFYPRPLRGGRHGFGDRHSCAGQFLSTPSARRATHPLKQVTGLQDISIHALCEEGDDHVNYRLDGIHKFLSTPSARRAT